MLLSMLERPLEDQQEFGKIIRRLHIPLYEEAQRYWQEAKDGGFFNDVDESCPYQYFLEGIIEEYGQL